jgi:hypothetical protein
MELGGQNICPTTFAPHVWHLRGRLRVNLHHLPIYPIIQTGPWCSRCKKNAVLKNSTSAENIQTKTGERCNANIMHLLLLLRAHTHFFQRQILKSLVRSTHALAACMHAWFDPLTGNNKKKIKRHIASVLVRSICAWIQVEEFRRA